MGSARSGNRNPRTSDNPYGRSTISARGNTLDLAAYLTAKYPIQYPPEMEKWLKQHNPDPYEISACPPPSLHGDQEDLDNWVRWQCWASRPRARSRNSSVR